MEIYLLLEKQRFPIFFIENYYSEMKVRYWIVKAGPLTRLHIQQKLLLSPLGSSLSFRETNRNIVTYSRKQLERYNAYYSMVEGM